MSLATSRQKSKEERRLNNRQKLLSLKRHSGFLKRPEILETVYSVEEDGTDQNSQNAAAGSSSIGSGGQSAPPTGVKAGFIFVHIFDANVYHNLSSLQLPHVTNIFEE